MLGIGFDSGGTHTSFALDRGEGYVQTPRNEATWSISDARGDSSSREAVRWISSIVQEQPDEEVCVWIGAAGFAGASIRDIRDLFEGAVSQIADTYERSGRCCEMYICNDAVSILKAPPLLGTGVAAIVGTGSVVMGAHPGYRSGLMKRGGLEWLVSDHGSGVWMTLECIKRLLRDIQTHGGQNYHSPLLDRLCDFFSVPADAMQDIPASHRPSAMAEAIARKTASNRSDAKRFFASFVYPHLFDLCTLDAGRTHDPIAAEVLDASVQMISDEIVAVSEALAAHTADDPNLRESLPVVVGGNIAANPAYSQRLTSALSAKGRYIESVASIGDPAPSLAALAVRILQAAPGEKAALTASYDPLHPVLRLL